MELFRGVSGRAAGGFWGDGRRKRPFMPPAGYFLSSAKESNQRTPPETGWFLEIAEAPPVADEARRFRGSVLIGGHEVAGNRLTRRCIFLRAPRTFRVVGVRATRLEDFARGSKCRIVSALAPLPLTVQNVGVHGSLERADVGIGPYGGLRNFRRRSLRAGDAGICPGGDVRKFPVRAPYILAGHTGPALQRSSFDRNL